MNNSQHKWQSFYYCSILNGGTVEARKKLTLKIIFRVSVFQLANQDITRFSIEANRKPHIYQKLKLYDKLKSIYL